MTIHKNIDGKVFGCIEIIGDTGKRSKARSRIMLARNLESGEFIEVDAASVNRGNTTGYRGSMQSSTHMKTIRKKERCSFESSLIGRTFGRLRITGIGEVRGKDRYVPVQNIETGEKKVVSYSSLKSGYSTGADRSKIIPRRKKLPSTGAQGVYFRKDTKKFNARVGQQNLGDYMTLQEAIDARKEAIKQLLGGN